MPDISREVLEKMIDSQIANTEVLTSLKDTLSDTNETLKKLELFFANGFRQDIKSLARDNTESRKKLDDIGIYVTSVFDKTELIIDQNTESHRKIDFYRGARFWFGSFAVIMAGIVAISGIVFGVLQTFQFLSGK